MILERRFQLTAYNRTGDSVFMTTFPNKTQAIKEGRFLKREGYAFSYQVYERTAPDRFELIAKG